MIRNPETLKAAKERRKLNKNWGNKYHPYTPKDPDKKKEYDRKYRQSEKGRENVKARKYKVRSLDRVANFRMAEWLLVLRKFDDKCAYCGESGKMTIDHILPISRGGTSEMSNLLPACITCNRKKGNKLINEFCTEAQLQRIEKINSY